MAVLHKLSDAPAGSKMIGQTWGIKTLRVWRHVYADDIIAAVHSDSIGMTLSRKIKAFLISLLQK